MDMYNFLRESNMNKKVIFTFGRFQPLTIGHEKMIRKMVSEARSSNSDIIIFCSQTNDNDKNPLLWETKIRLIEHCFPGVPINRDKDIKTPYQALEFLAEQYTEIKFICGDDRINNFASMEKYSSEWGVSKFLIESAGARKGQDLSTNASASKARDAVRRNNKQDFARLMPSTMQQNVIDDLYAQLQSAMGLEESPEEMNKEAEDYRKGTMNGIFVYQGWG